MTIEQIRDAAIVFDAEPDGQLAIAVPLSMAARTVARVREVDVERIGGRSGPDAYAVVVTAAHLGPGHAVGQPDAEFVVVVRVLAGQPVHGDGLLPGRVGLAERHPVRQVLVQQAVEVDFELVAGLGVEARLGVQAVDVGVRRP